MLMTRRHFLQGLGAIGLLATLAPRMARAAGTRAQPLILIELKGGNDGLNTVIPYREGGYLEARGELALTANEVIELAKPDGTALGLHPALAPLAEAWAAGDLAWVLGLGYPNPNRSHFRSIEIWDTAEPDDIEASGWLDRLAEVARSYGVAFPSPLNGVILAQGGDGPIAGAALPSVHLSDPDRFAQSGQRLDPIDLSVTGGSLAHIIDTHNGVRQASDELAAALDTVPDLASDFPDTDIGRQLAVAARLVIAGVDARAIKTGLGSFDTHANQAGTHAGLLTQVGEAVMALRAVLRDAGLWSQSLVMSYSEFGRRLAANGSLGTDHGTAAPHFVLGGRVNGGLFGRYPSLTDLDSQGDVRFTTDFRALYSTIAAQWWDVPGNHPWGDGFAPIGALIRPA